MPFIPYILIKALILKPKLKNDEKNINNISIIPIILIPSNQIILVLSILL